MRQFSCAKVALDFPVAFLFAQKYWLETHGATLAGYIERYGKEDGEILWAADVRRLARFEADVAALQAKAQKPKPGPWVPVCPDCWYKVIPAQYMPDWKDHEPEDCWVCGETTEVGLHIRKGEVDAYLYDLTLPTNR